MSNDRFKQAQASRRVQDPLAGSYFRRARVKRKARRLARRVLKAELRGLGR